MDDFDSWFEDLKRDMDSGDGFDWDAPADRPATSEPEPTPERIMGRAADAEVYVSNSNGIVHAKSNCSGMKYYWTTTVKAAYDAGYEFCDKCW